jgi:hypothetical protein
LASRARIVCGALVPLCTLLTPGCATIDYSSLPPGTFEGDLVVMWVGEGGSAGDGKFLFVPDPQRPLIFHRQGGRRPGATIAPGTMYTDGGSIPKIGQLFNGFSPWGYAPAYMIHDWMFVARHCIVDGQDSPKYNDVRDVDFDTSADILGEAIRGLVASGRVKKNDLAGSVITSAVHGSIAKNLWDKRGACDDEKVSMKDLAAVAAAFPPEAARSLANAARVSPEALAAAKARPARPVARMSF